MMLLLRFFRWITSIQIIVSCVAKANAYLLRPDHEQAAVEPSLASSRSVRRSLVQVQEQEQRRTGGCRMRMMMSKSASRCRTPTRPRRFTASPTSKPSSEPSSLPSSVPSLQPTQSPTEDACPSYKSDPNGVNPSHLYGIMTDRLYTWIQAQARVRSMKSCCGGVRPHLVSIGGAQENAFVLSLTDRTLWLGLTNRNQSNAATFAWDGTNETFGYQNWCTPGNGGCETVHPDAGPNACAYMSHNFGPITPGVWGDTICDVVLAGFVFEYDCV